MKKTQTQKIFTIVAALAVVPLVLAVAVMIQKIAPLTSHALTGDDHTPVILVHGYVGRDGNCQTLNLDTYWGKVKTELTQRAGIPATSVIPVAYYRCDNHGVDISGYGPGTSYGFAKTNGTTKGRAGYTNQTSITQISHDLAWFIYNEYTRKGQPVNVVGHSMGGLIIREALRETQAGAPSFPSRIDVRKVLTMSTPHNGWGEQCKKNTQCAELSDGSQFLANLQTNPAPQGSAGTDWWSMGLSGVDKSATYVGSTCDFIPTDSVTAIAGTHLLYTKPCYRHNGYLTDSSQKLDAEGSSELEGRHSLRVMVDIMK